MSALPRIDAHWTLFLDRDGVLNRRLVGDYVKRPGEFVWLPGVLPALRLLTPRFGRTVVVTNQQGVGKGLMTQGDLDVIHGKMRQQAAFEHARIDAVYACTALAAAGDARRKPGTGMALEARADFPAIDFARSVLVGDSPSDIAFGRGVGMYCVRIAAKEDPGADATFANLYDFAAALTDDASGTEPPEGH